jgi:hypothetical protein
LLYACSQTEQKKEPDEDVGDNQYPEAMSKVWEAHGGLDQWRKMEALYFEIANEGQNEKNYVQLKDRWDRIEGENYIMGYNGVEVWLEADTAYKGNPEFYHNLNFYFLAMPFVMADDGINYSTAEPLKFGGVTYPGVGITYEEGVGTSPRDEYFIYYDAETYQMAWLGYTVTFFSGEKSDDIHWIRYSEWDEFNGLKLPTKLTWYNYEDGLPTEARNDKRFVNLDLMTDPFADDLFASP